MTVHDFVIDHFKLNIKRSGWTTTSQACPFCGKTDHHFGIKLYEGNKVSYNCFVCASKGGSFKLLRSLDMLELLDEEIHGLTITTEQIENKIKKENEDNGEAIKRPIPQGYKAITKHPYLLSRGFKEWQFNKYNIGTTSEKPNYILFLIEEDNECKGYLGRRTDDSLTNLPKWINDEGDFDRLVFGLEEIVEDTKKVIIVEGLTDKANVDARLKLNERDGEVVCVSTFGKKISKHQIKKIRERGVGVEDVFLFYDPDAINNSKKFSFELDYSFDNVKVVAPIVDKDPGDMTRDEIIKSLQQATSPIHHKIGKVLIRKLKC